MGDRLELDTSVLKEKNQIGESLTDLNNLHLFTDEFGLLLDKKKNGDYIVDQNLKEQCFSSIDIQNEECGLISKMFCSEQKIGSSDIEKETDYGNYYMLLGSILVGLFICSIVFRITDKKGNKINDIDINY